MAQPIVHLSPKSVADLKQLGEAYRAGDKDIRKAIRDGLTKAGKPLADKVVREGAAKMPRRGGFAARIAASRGRVAGSYTSRGATVSIAIANREKDALKALDEGQLRHPVWKTGVWAAQSVPAHAFTNAFNAGADDVRDDMNEAVDAALNDIARRAT